MICLKPTYELKSNLNYEEARLSDNYDYCIKVLVRENLHVLYHILLLDSGNLYKSETFVT